MVNMACGISLKLQVADLDGLTRITAMRERHKPESRFSRYNVMKLVR